MVKTQSNKKCIQIIYQENNDDLEDVAKTVDAWKKLDEHGYDYVAENSEEKKKLRKKLREKKKGIFQIQFGFLLLLNLFDVDTR